MGFERVFRSLLVSEVAGWGLEGSGVGVGARIGEPWSRTFAESKSGIAAGWGGRRHEGAESRSSCCGSRDVGWARKSQGGVSLELIARE